MLFRSGQLGIERKNEADEHKASFVQAGTELAYFSDNKLYVMRLEAVEQISIGTSINGFLDIVTTPTGVGFKWRA